MFLIAQDGRELMTANKAKERQKCYGCGKSGDFKRNCRAALSADHRTQESQYHSESWDDPGWHHCYADALCRRLCNKRKHCKRVDERVDSVYAPTDWTTEKAMIPFNPFSHLCAHAFLCLWLKRAWEPYNCPPISREMGMKWNIGNYSVRSDVFYKVCLKSNVLKVIECYSVYCWK